MVVEGVVERVRRGSFNRPECLTLEGAERSANAGEISARAFRPYKGLFSAYALSFT